MDNARQELIALINGSQFSVTRQRPGYRMQEVDAFLDAVRAGLDGLGPPVTAQQIREVKFGTTRLRSAYDEREVDDFLDRLVAGMAR
jgi:DivIVA domain-containing protein